jgi:hypothetical protein
VACDSGTPPEGALLLEATGWCSGQPFRLEAGSQAACINVRWSTGIPAVTLTAVLQVVTTSHTRQNERARKHQPAAMSYLRDIMRRLAARRTSTAASPASEVAGPAMGNGRSQTQDGPDPTGTSEAWSQPLDDQGAGQARAAQERG